MSRIRAALALSLAAIVVGGTGCQTKPESEEPKAVLEAPTGEGVLSGKLEVGAFKGGYGVDFFEKVAKDFARQHEGLEVEVWGDERSWEKLRPRFNSNTPPDLVFPGWGMDHWALVGDGQVLALDKALDSKPAEGEGTWRATFDPNMLKLCQQDGKTWMLPYYVMTYGWWYDANVFAANGWSPPKTWNELLALCEKIKAKGMAPITFQGKYPYYMLEGMYFPWVQHVGGMEALRALQNLEPGAWTAEPAKRAAEMLAELRDKGYLAPGAVGLSHTESQMELLLGRAAMLPCGSWLESEMGKQMDEIAKSGKTRPRLTFMLPPAPLDGKGADDVMLIGIEPWMVPSKAKNPNAAVALFKAMTSTSNAKAFVREKGTLMSIKGSDEGDLPESLRVQAEALKGASAVWSNQMRFWYPEFETELENALTALLNKELTPEAFCERIEKAAQAVREDDAIRKYTVAF